MPSKFSLPCSFLRCFQAERPTRNISDEKNLFKALPALNKMENLDTNALYARMAEICHLVPTSEIEYIVRTILVEQEGLTREEAFVPEQINKAGFAFLHGRLLNQVCHHCGGNARDGFRKVAPRDYPALLECEKCKMTHYCSEDCREKDRAVHERWCCNVDAPRDEGINKIVFINTQTGKVIR